MDDGITYLSGVRHPELDFLASYEGDYGILPPIGVLVQPLTECYLRDADQYYRTVGVDNGCFTEIGRRLFSLRSYERMAKRAVELFGGNCLFVTAPDVPFDWKATLAASLPVLGTIRGWGCPAAMVWQDGATVENMPWDEFDVGFIGGSTEWKLGDEAAALTAEANRRGKLVHMGRVNSKNRLLTAQRFGCKTADGTYLMHEIKKGIDPATAASRMVDWVRSTFSVRQSEIREDLKRNHGVSDDGIKALRMAGYIW